MYTGTIALVADLIFIGLAVALYCVLIKAISIKSLGPFTASIILLLYIASVPFIFMLCSLFFADYIYTTYPSLRVPSWDVGMVFVFYFNMYLSYGVGVLISLIALWKFFRKSHHNRLSINN